MEHTSLLENRKASFIIVTLVYIIAAIVGIFVYNALHYDLWLDLLIADVVATIVVFIFSCIFGNASVYDPYWSVQPPVIVTLFAFGVGLTPVRVLLLIAIWYWGIRLTGNWAYTFHGLTHQDWRYTMLHDKTKAFYPAINFLGIHMFPTIVVYACILPAVYAMIHVSEMNVGCVIFFLVSVGAATLQLIADRQMHAFRKQKKAGMVNIGIWKYSRHPNYLGEILMWWGVALAVICVMPEYWYLGFGALLNTIMFLAVSIPMQEKRQSAKEGYAEYKRHTGMLIPMKK